MENKKEGFKLLIKEFHESKLPTIIRRDLPIARKSNKIITIIGPRRAGKTYFFYQLISELKNKIPFERVAYINFEDDRILPLSFKDLNSFLDAYFELYPDNKEHSLFLFFDEIQNIEGWETFVRRIYDKEKVNLYITGSSSKLLSYEIATSLRGRTLCYKIFPLNFREFLRFKGLEVGADFAYSKIRYKIKHLLADYINFGGFPEVILSDPGLKNQILKNYYDLVIYRDIVDRFTIRNIRLLKDMSRFLITNIAAPFSINAYYRSLLSQHHVSRETILEYISYLEEIDFIQLVPIFSHSLKVQQVNPKKVYVIDNGLRNAVCFRFSQDVGRLVENLVFQHLRRLGYDIYYWRQRGEVDFIIKKYDELFAINVSYGAVLNKREIDGLLEFKKIYKNRVRDLLIITNELEKVEGEIRYVPLWKWLMSIENDRKAVPYP